MELRLKEGLLVAINVNGVGLVSMRVTDGSGWYRLTERSDHAFLRLSELRPFTYEVLLTISQGEQITGMAQTTLNDVMIGKVENDKLENAFYYPTATATATLHSIESFGYGVRRSSMSYQVILYYGNQWQKSCHWSPWDLPILLARPSSASHTLSLELSHLRKAETAIY